MSPEKLTHCVTVRLVTRGRKIVEEHRLSSNEAALDMLEQMEAKWQPNRDYSFEYRDTTIFKKRA